MELAILIRQDAILERLVQRLLHAPDGVTMTELAEELYQGKVESRLSALSRKLSALPDEGWISRVRRPDASKVVRLTEEGRRSALGVAPDTDRLERRCKLGRLIGQTERLDFDHQDRVRSWVYMLVGLRSFVRSDAALDIGLAELDALQAALDALLDRTVTSGAIEEGRKPISRLSSLLIDVLAAAPDDPEQVERDDGVWIQLYDRCWTLRQARLPRSLRSIWGALACTIASAFGGSRSGQDQRVRLQEAVCEDLDRALEEESEDMLGGLLLRHWAALAADTRGHTETARRVWLQNGEMINQLDGARDRDLCAALTWYSCFNAERVVREHPTDVQVRHLLARRQLLPSGGAGPLSWSEALQITASLRDPWRRLNAKDVGAAAERPTPALLCDTTREAPRETSRLKDPTAQTVRQWYREIDDITPAQARFDATRVGHLQAISRHNFFSCGTAIAHVYAGNTTL